MSNLFVGFDIFTKQRTDDEHPYGEDSHLDDDSILERHGDVETDDNYYDEDDDVDLQWGKVSDAAKGAVGAAKTAGTAIGAAGQQAAKTAQSAGQRAAKTAGQAATGFGQQAAQTAATGLVAGKEAAQTAGTAAGAKVSDAAQTAKGFGQKAAQTAAAGLTAGKETAQTAGTAAGAKVAGAFGKSHDDMMASLDQAIGLMEKQVDTDEEAFYDEPTGNRTAVRSVERGDDDLLDYSPEDIEEFDYDEDPTSLNAAQREAAQEVARNRQQGIAANKKYEAERAVPSSREQDQGQYPEANVFPSPEAGPSPSHFSEEELLDSLRVPEGRKRRGVLTPANISTSARENQLEEEDRRKRAEQSRRVREEAAVVREIKPMEMTKVGEESEDEDYFSQSADSVLAKALGSVIGIMEKQDPRFRCQECGTKVPKGGRKCRKCGSEDIDLA